MRIAKILATDRPLMICLAVSNGSTGAGTASGAFLMGQFLAHRKNNVLSTDNLRRAVLQEHGLLDSAHGFDFMREGRRSLVGWQTLLNLSNGSLFHGFCSPSLAIAAS
jgi:hypothetical protein